LYVLLKGLLALYEPIVICFATRQKMAERPRQKGGGAEHSNFQKTMKVYDGGIY